MSELSKRLRANMNTLDYTERCGLVKEAADALTAADTRHDDDQRAHALLEQVIVRRDDEIKRLRDQLVWISNAIDRTLAEDKSRKKEQNEQHT